MDDYRRFVASAQDRRVNYFPYVASLKNATNFFMNFRTLHSSTARTQPYDDYHSQIDYDFFDM